MITYFVDNYKDNTQKRSFSMVIAENNKKNMNSGSVKGCYKMIVWWLVDTKKGSKIDPFFVLQQHFLFGAFNIRSIACVYLDFFAGFDEKRYPNGSTGFNGSRF